MSSRCAGALVFVEDLEHRVVERDVDRVTQHYAERGVRDRSQEIGHVGPVAVERVAGNVEAESRKLVSLAMNRQRVVALALHEVRQDRRANAPCRSGLAARGRHGVSSACLAGQLFASLHVHHELGGHVLNPLVLDKADAGHFCVARLASALAALDACWFVDNALERRRESRAAWMRALLLLGLRLSSALIDLGLEWGWHGDLRLLGSRLLFRTAEGENQLAQVLARQLLATASPHETLEVGEQLVQLVAFDLQRVDLGSKGGVLGLARPPLGVQCVLQHATVGSKLELRALHLQKMGAQHRGVVLFLKIDLRHRREPRFERSDVAPRDLRNLLARLLRQDGECLAPEIGRTSLAFTRLRLAA